MAVLQEMRTGKATFVLLLAIWYLQINQQTIKVPRLKRKLIQTLIYKHTLNILYTWPGFSLRIVQLHEKHLSFSEGIPSPVRSMKRES